MASRYETLTVALAAPLRNGKFSVGTGVPIREGLVLTARHVVCPEVAEPRPVRLRFWHAREREFAPDPAQNFNGFVDALVDRSGDDHSQRGVVWSSPRLDVALVRSPHPPSIGHATIGSREPFDDAEWRCEAFPHAAWEDGAPEPVRLTGKSHSRFPGTARFQIDANIAMRFTSDATAHVAEGWGGASGAPLFVNGQVMGILLTRKPNGEAKILDGVPIVDCLDEPEFCALLGLGEESPDPYGAALLAALATVSPILRIRLVQAFGLEDNASDADLGKALRAEAFERGLEILGAVRRGANRQEDALMGQIALRYAACKCYPPQVAALRKALFEPRSEIDSCASGSRMGAEFLMAAAESRLPEFRIDGTRAAALPPGRYALPQLPETGFSPDTREHVADIEARIGADLLHTEIWLEDTMGPVCDFPVNSPQTIGFRRQILQQELAFRAAPERRKPSYYFTEVDPGRERIAERAALQARIDAVRENFPQIGAVYIQPHLAPQEFARFRPLQEMLPRETDNE